MTSQFHDLYNSDSANVENCGPSIAKYVPPNDTFILLGADSNISLPNFCETGLAIDTCATIPSSKNVFFLANVLSIN